MSWPKGRKRPEISGENSPNKRSEVREKISKANTGKKRSIEARLNYSKAKKGCKRPDLSELNKKRTGENNPNYGRRLPKRPDLSKRNREKPPMRGKKNPNLSKYMKNGGAAYILSFVKNPSKEQVQLFGKVKNFYPSAILNYPYQNYSIDIAIVELKIAIEFDGWFWHKGREEEDRKRQAEIEKGGWRFIRYQKLPEDNNLLEDLFSLQGKRRMIFEIDKTTEVK